MALEPTYDEWRQSDYPAKGITCQSCHFPTTQASRVNSGLPQAVRAHGGLPGAPSSLAGMADQTDLLRQAATLSLRAQRQDGELAAAVVITNSGTGHYLPTGSDDLRQVWLEVTVRNQDGQVVWQSGTLDRYGELDASTVQFHKVIGDADGRPIALHRFWMATQILNDTRLAPGEVRTIPYRLPLPGAGPYTLSARLLYRDVSQGFAEFALNHAAPDLPVREIAQTSVVIDP